MCFPDPYTYISVRMHGWSDVPAVNCMELPCFMGGWVIMDKELGSWWRKERSIVIKCVKYLSIGGELGVDS